MLKKIYLLLIINTVILSLTATCEHTAPTGPSIVRTVDGQYLLDPALLTFAHKKYGSLQQYCGTYFSAHFLTSPHLYPYLYTKKQKIEHCALKTPDNSIIHATYFNRNSDTLIIVGHGFTSCKEKMYGFVTLFPHYDLVFFDWPGHGKDRINSTALDAFSMRMTSAQISRMSFGLKETSFITTVCDYFSRKKQYKTTVGVCVCYAVYYFVQAAAEWEKTHLTPLFTKLILDSPWLSHSNAIKRLPQLKELYGLSKTWLLQQSTLLCCNMFSKVNIYNLPLLTQFLASLTKTELLFLHTPSDPLCTMADFNQLWESATAPKSCILLPTEHAIHHKQYKELYCLLTTLFIEHPINIFNQALLKPELLTNLL